MTQWVKYSMWVQVIKIHRKPDVPPHGYSFGVVYEVLSMKTVPPVHPANWYSQSLQLGKLKSSFLLASDVGAKKIKEPGL